VRSALVLMGLSLCAVMIPVTLMFIRQHPAEMDQFPDGKASPDMASAGFRKTTEDSGQFRKWAYGEVLRTVPFWAIVFTFLLAMGSMIAIGMHQISFLSQYVGATSAAFMVSLMTSASLVGRLVIGKIIDRYDKRTVVIGTLLCQALSVLMLAFFHQTIILYICTMILGLTLGSVLMAQSLLIGDCFGMISFGMVYGLASLFIQCGAAFGPLIGGLIFDATQSYQNAFIIFAGASALASVTVIFARRPDRVFN
jgi:predicted MFS family arabinose efflux permease